MIKNLIVKLISFFGFKIINIKKDKSNIFNFIEKLCTKEDPVIFDVGSFEGQSIIKFQKYFSKAIFHCFEPNPSSKDILSKKFSSNSNIKLNFVGLGDKLEKKFFYSLLHPGKSSFYRLNKNSEFYQLRKNEVNRNADSYIHSVNEVDLNTVDHYSKQNNIDHIDILKIDTQGYEEKVLSGAKNLIEKNEIDIILVEIIFSEIYKNNNNIYNIEKLIIPNGYKLFGNSSYGNLYSDFNWETDFLYISQKIYNKIRNVKEFKSFSKQQ